MNSGAGAGEQPFAKVKKIITDSIDRLQPQASSQANAVENPFSEVKELVTDLITDSIDRLQSEAMLVNIR